MAVSKHRSMFGRHNVPKSYILSGTEKPATSINHQTQELETSPNSYRNQLTQQLLPVDQEQHHL